MRLCLPAEAVPVSRLGPGREQKLRDKALHGGAAGSGGGDLFEGIDIRELTRAGLFGGLSAEALRLPPVADENLAIAMAAGMGGRLDAAKASAASLFGGVV